LGDACKRDVTAFKNPKKTVGGLRPSEVYIHIYGRKHHGDESTRIRNSQIGSKAGHSAKKCGPF